ncbi:hypothetical protein KZX45_14225 [Georgenia sp. EYE_87]|uniref:hypothetical protein n=1 Tax=Georgenia sp. EYE_87 TaxID=2853448 RepID=UPI00200629D2|nr:hypothetical protein [Georgenia sp. EYE_87]MCK6211703.1 hypothetical protein [Georgenia sp. EYE_87]
MIGALVLAIVVGLATWWLPRLGADAAPLTSSTHGHGSAGTVPRNAAQQAFHDDMRKLWEDHVTWTRLAIVTFAEDSPSFPATAERLLQNQVDIGDAIKPYYGEAAGDQLTALLTDHILIAVEILEAARAGDGDALADARSRWSANGDDIGNFLGAANPRHWPADQMRAGMATHLEQTFSEAANELGGNYAASVADYDAAHLHVLDMADTLSGGLIAQFPARFR